MNSGIVTAIASGITLLAATVGYWGGMRSARLAAETSTKNAQLMVAAEHYRHIWSRRADLYVDILAFATDQHRDLQHLLEGCQWDERTKTETESSLSSYQEPSWFELEGRIHAFASDSVVKAFANITKAVSELRAAVTQQQHIQALNRKAIEEANLTNARLGGQIANEAAATVRDALAAEAAAVGNLITAVRAEIQHDIMEANHSRPSDHETGR